MLVRFRKSFETYKEKRGRFCAACADGNLEVINELLHDKTITSHPALLNMGVNLATTFNKLHILKALLSAGADPNRPHKDWEGGDPALVVAIRKDYTAIVEALLSAGASIHLRSSYDGKNALTTAKSRAVAEMLALVVKEEKYKNDMALFKTQKETFAYGGFFKDKMISNGEIKENKSSIVTLVRDPLFHAQAVQQELFSFLEPKKLT
jgi:hypothetical protein